MPRALWLILTSLLCLALHPPCLAQGPASRPAPQPASLNLSVYLVTFEPGDAIYERFGHNAIWIHDKTSGRGVTYNYGVFNFEEHNFILRFVLGRMEYEVAAWPEVSIDDYKRDNRTTIVQELNLTAKQKMALLEFLERNIEPANRKYRYDYYTSNCSTKVRDALDTVLEGRIKKQLEGVATDHTYRDHTRIATTNNPLMYTALNAVLGHSVDRKISAWEEGYLPMLLSEHLKKVITEDENGRPVSLIRQESIRFQSTREPLALTPPRWWPYFLILGIAVGGAWVWLGHLARRGKWQRRGFMLFAIGWVFLVAFAGVMAAIFWMFTSHVAAYNNENLLQLNPLAAGLLVCLVLAGIHKTKAWKPARSLAAAIAVISAAGLGLKILPSFRQVNWELIALLLPAHIGMTLALFRYRPTPAAASPAKALYKRPRQRR